MTFKHLKSVEIPECLLQVMLFILRLIFHCPSKRFAITIEVTFLSQTLLRT